MMKEIIVLLLFAFRLTPSESRPNTSPKPQVAENFNLTYIQQIYAPRLDDPSTRTFERCSSDTFQVYGPCAYQICYVYLHRTGPDGWKPQSVTIYGVNTRSVTFTYNTFIPGDTWYGFNLCSGASSSPQLAGQKRLILGIFLGFVLSALLI